MKDIDDIIKRLNLFFTDTVDKNSCNINDLKKIENNTDNCISLYNLIEYFNKLYLAFINEYYKSKIIDLGEDIIIVDFIKSIELLYRELLVYVHNPNMIDETSAFLHLIDYDNHISSYVSNGMNIFDKRYYCNVDLDKEEIRKFIDLFDKYNILFILFNNLKNNMIYGDGTHFMFSKIEYKEENILKGLNTLNFKIGFNDKKNSFNLSICINLGNNFGIDYKNSKIDLYNLDIKYNNEDLLKILKNVFVNEKYLNSYSDRVNKKESVNIKLLSKTID